MSTISIQQIIERLEQLPDDRLEAVYEFITSLVEGKANRHGKHSIAQLTMFASEDILKRDWDRPEEDAAWADL